MGEVPGQGICKAEVGRLITGSHAVHTSMKTYGGPIHNADYNSPEISYLRLCSAKLDDEYHVRFPLALPCFQQLTAQQ